MTRISQERSTVAKMIRLYCRNKEGNRELCENCRKLLAYSNNRLDRCPFGNQKTTCRKCPVHCYKSDMKEQMRAVMRYAGPRMIFHHPIAAIRHLFK